MSEIKETFPDENTLKHQGYFLFKLYGRGFKRYNVPHPYIPFKSIEKHSSYGQDFVLEDKLSMEAIPTMSNEELGKYTKERYNKLIERVKQYENGSN